MLRGREHSHIEPEAHGEVAFVPPELTALKRAGMTRKVVAALGRELKAEALIEGAILKAVDTRTRRA